MMNFSKFAAVATVATAAIATSSAVMPSSAQAFSLAIDPQFGSTENTGSTAKLNFDFVQSGSSVLLNLGMINTTNGIVGLKATESTLVGIAFDTPDTVSGVSLQSPNGSAFTQLWQNVSLQPFGTYDVGISTPRNSFEGGNANQGLKAGKSATVSFLFNTTLDATALEKVFLEGFTNGSLRAAGRFQQVDVGSGSDKVRGGIIQPPPVQKVPEPSALLGILTMGGVLLGHKRLQGKTKLTQSV
ncbi:MAG: PEP-CTERM sorting domain-containing protein [Myxacorys californica WJT36-NPBG1]|jgi:hypothetical protein|nr:PEP-CTERM sorting domain-containing protein [Myxacorys californica WJT36-NPBG1]